MYLVKKSNSNENLYEDLIFLVNGGDLFQKAHWLKNERLCDLPLQMGSSKLDDESSLRRELK